MRNHKTVDVEKQIAIHIISAQIASDAGKGIYELAPSTHKFRTPRHFGYSVKTWYIMTAINLIRNHQTGFNYYLSDIEDDQNGYDSIIAYFDFKINNKRYQVSFHTPYSQIPPEMMEMSGSGRKTRWRKNHESSRYACEMLNQHFNL